MKKFLICIVLVGLIFPQNRNQRNLNRNIDQFRMTSFTRPLESGSVEIMSFVVIPNRSLQFIKEKNKFTRFQEFIIHCISCIKVELSRIFK